MAMAMLGLVACASGRVRRSEGGVTVPHPLREAFLVVLRTGPRNGRLDPEEQQEAMAGHFSNMARLSEERKLILAGPFGAVRSDRARRGLFILATADPATALEWTRTDPAVAAGIFAAEATRFATAAPLAVALERELGRQTRAREEGRTLRPGDGGRGYVLLTAEDRALAWEALSPRVGREVLVLAELGATQALAILDATHAADAEARLGGWIAASGPHVLEDWFGSGELARIWVDDEAPPVRAARTP
jgi:uncharacterized protein YciI